MKTNARTVKAWVLCGSVATAALALGACKAEAPRPSEPERGRAASAFSFSSGGNAGYTGQSLGYGQLALTFDDGPGSQALALSSYLRSKGIRATFFVNGHCFGSSVYSNGQCQQDASASPGDILGQLEADGHLVGNHTEDHYDLTDTSTFPFGSGDSALIAEVADTDSIIAPYVASGHFLFRAPFGAWSSHDYDVLQGSAMSKYTGPIKWDVGSAMTDRYAADWDCWQNQDGYGIQTSASCGDRYMNEILDVGRGIVLMHDADYGDVSNHDLYNGRGNTIDMARYLLDNLLARGFTFVRTDEVPDIAADLGSGGGGGGGSTGGGGGSTGGGGSCAFDPTWAQTSYADEWWVEYTISGSVAAASLEVVDGQTVTLSSQYGKWVGGPSAQIPTGTSVVLHARDTAGDTANTSTFRYLVDTAPATACGTSTGGGGGTTTDAGSTGGGGASGSCFTTTWSQTSYANTWWVEYTIGGTITSAFLEVVGGQTVNLSSEYGKWVGGPNQEIPAGTSVVVHATSASGGHAQTVPFGYLNVTSPQSQACP